MTRSLDFVTGWPLITSARLNRWREMPKGSQARVRPGDVVKPETVVAQGSGRQVVAALLGRVAEVQPERGILIDGAAAILSGVLGIGATATGPIWFIPRGESPSMAALQPGAILVYPQRIPITLIQRALQSGVVGIVASSASARELEGFARMDITAMLDGQAPLAPPSPLPMMLTEGIGDRPMDATVLRYLMVRAGQTATLSGLTRPRQNIRPELLLAPEEGITPVGLPQDTSLRAGSLIRVLVGEHAGARGQLVQALTHAQPDPLGRVQPTARFRLENGEVVPLPLAYVERVG